MTAAEAPAGGPLAGRAGIVTGGARGIGGAVCEAVVEAGGSVLVADVDGEAAAGHASELGERATSAAVDVREFAAVEDAVARCRETFGTIDFVVANAGIGDYSSMASGDPERWRRVIDTNLTGAAYTVRAALPHMRDQGRGDIVFMASIAGREAWAGEPIYIATKWGMVGLARSLRLEASAWGVRVALVEPSIVDTPLVRSTAEGRSELERFASLRAEDVGRTVAHVLAQPPEMTVTEVELRPLGAEA